MDEPRICSILGIVKIDGNKLGPDSLVHRIAGIFQERLEFEDARHVSTDLANCLLIIVWVSEEITVNPFFGRPLKRLKCHGDEEYQRYLK